MGNESSSGILSDCAIDESPILTCEAWRLYHGERVEDNGRPIPKQQLSVFLSKKRKGESSRSQPFGQNLKLYRHPRILKYVASCSVADQHYLFAEKASPLSAVLKSQSPLQICLGLHDVLEALQFLHEVGRSSHNNVCVGSVFVTPSDGRWKLGLEFVKRFEEESQSFLDQTRPLRSPNSVPPEEKAGAKVGKGPLVATARDAYGFGRLAQAALDAVVDDENVHARSFLDLCRTHLCNPDPSRRPQSLKDEVASHPYFSEQKYLSVHRFLADLPLKSDEQKADFFSSLPAVLSALPLSDDDSAPAWHQLAGPLLSRYVLLDRTARERLLPGLLTPARCPRRDFDPDPSALNPLVPEPVFRDVVCPVLLNVLQVRENQIRSILLRYFSSYCNTFSPAALRDCVLPQLLLGVRDTCDDLVADTLRALADLVPLLGAGVVVGDSGRRKIFADGKPRVPAASSNSNAAQRALFSKTKPAAKANFQERIKREESSSPPSSYLHERRSPIGAENSDADASRGGDDAADAVADDDGWDDWGEEDAGEESEQRDIEEEEAEERTEEGQLGQAPSVALLNPRPARPKEVVDIGELDIKVSRPADSGPDFFADMVPQIKTAERADFGSAGEAKQEPGGDVGDTKKGSLSSRLGVATVVDGDDGDAGPTPAGDDGGGGGGWGDWGDEDEEVVL